MPDHAPKTGLIVASSMFLVATPFDSAVTLVAAMTRLQQPQPVTASCGGAWRVHFAVQLERPSGEETLELEFYDVSISAPAAGRTRMFFSEIATHRGDTTIFVNDFVIATDLGFAAGHEYEVSVRRPDRLWPAGAGEGTFHASRLMPGYFPVRAAVVLPAGATSQPSAFMTSSGVS